MADTLETAVLSPSLCLFLPLSLSLLHYVVFALVLWKCLACYLLSLLSKILTKIPLEDVCEC